jgi:PAS domain S-box-containing protein
MAANDKTKTQLLEEVERLQKKVAAFEASEKARGRTEEALRRSEREKELILGNVGELVLYQSPDMRIVWASNAAAESLGLPSEELVGRHCHELWHGRSEPCNGCPVVTAIETGVPARTEMETPDGRIWDVRGYPALGDDGTPVGAAEVTREITREKRAEEALRESEEQFRTLVEGAADAIFLNTLEGEIRDVNGRACESLGYTRDELLSMTLADIDLEVENRGHRELYRDHLEPGNFLTLEGTHRRKDGTTFPVEIRVGLVQTHQGPLMLGLARDVTDRKRMEAALNDSLERERLLSSVIERSSQPFAVTHPDGRLLRINPAFCVLTGYTEGELERISALTDLTPLEWREMEAAELEALHRTGRPRRYEKEYLRKDGSRIEVEVIVHEACDAGGNVEHYYGFVTDITERKQREAELRQSEERYRALYEASRDGYAMVDMQGTIIRSNSTFKEMLGYTDRELAGMTYREITPEKWHSMEEKILKEQVRERGYSDVYEKEYRRKDGTLLPIEIRTNLLKDEDGNPAGMWCFVRDMTDRKLAEQERQRLEARLQQTQKMEALGTLAGGIAHDFNNILAVISGFTELLMLEAEEDPSLSEKLGQVLQASKRGADLVGQILTFSQQARPEKKSIDLRIVIREALKFLRASLPTTIEIRERLSVKSGRILGDPTQIHQVMLNLCGNAAQAMQEKGGLLEVRLEQVVLDSEDLGESSDLEPGPYLKLTTSDTGHGIPKEVIDRIFDPFFSTRTRGKGTGMGLAVVHGIVQEHGGTIRVRSEEGRGAVFDVFLPMLESKGRPEAIEAQAPAAGSARILFVDDEPMVVDYASRILEHLGYEVVGRTSSIEALEVFRAAPGEFDLVITDMTMPNMTGAELSKMLLEIRPELPIILCTGFSEAIDPERAEKIGIRKMLTKPVLAKDLGDSIKKVLQLD